MQSVQQRRRASAIWRGALKSGSGTMSTQSQTMREFPYSFGKRFEDSEGPSPEELIAAAHAGCFSMQLSGELEKAGFQPGAIETQATVTISKFDDGWRVTQVHLDVEGGAHGIDEDAFQNAAEQARRNCPVSKLLDTEITLESKLRRQAA